MEYGDFEMRMIVGLCGAIEPDSRLLAAVRLATALATDRRPVPVADFSVIEHAVRAARYRSELDRSTLVILREIEAAPGLILGIPAGTGTIPGLMKHFLDLADPDSLAGKPVLLITDSHHPGLDARADLCLRLTIGQLGLDVADAPVAAGRHAISRSGAASPALDARLRDAVRTLANAAVARSRPAPPPIAGPRRSPLRLVRH